MIAYQSELAVIHHGDARDVLEAIPTESVHLVVTDPPYGVQWQSSRRADTFDQLDNDGADDREGIRAVLKECVRVVGQNRHLYVFGPSDVVEGLKVSAPATLIWDKATLGAGDVTAAWAPAHEPITFAVSKNRHAGEAGTEGVPTRLRKGSVLRFPRQTGRKVRHPSEKPVPLLSELIESSSRRGDTVLDPFAGIGSTGVAAILCGRTCIMADTDERWVTLMVERVKAAERVATQMREV